MIPTLGVNQGKDLRSVVCRTFAVDELAPRSARGLLRETLFSWQLLELTGDATTAVSELVTNVHQHARTDKVEVTVIDMFASLWVGVWDGAPIPEGFPPSGLADEFATSGRGWGIVRCLAESSGVAPDGVRGGKTAWFRLSKSSAEK